MEYPKNWSWSKVSNHEQNVEKLKDIWELNATYFMNWIWNSERELILQLN